MIAGTVGHPGRRLGQYEIRRKLGRGGMADVYLAEDGETGALVALKVIEHSDDADTREAIIAEKRGAELQAHLAAIDARVGRVYHAGDLDGFFYLAMEYVEGEDLAELMRRGPLLPEFAVDVALAVSETLDYAHNLQVAIDGKDFQGVVHGDIKPKNIRIDTHGEVRVLDFGIAKALSLSRRLTRNEFGSVPYASPERLDSGEVSAMSDLWSLGVMLYEMVTGLAPYHSDSTERLESMIRSRIPPPPAPDPCPEPLRRILRKALSPAVEARYHSARELAADLQAFRNGQPVAISDDDLDATRRTRDQVDTDATRRTITPVRDTTGPLPRHSPRRRPSLFGYFVRAVAFVVLASIVYGSWVAVSEYRLWQHGQELQRQIETEQLTDPDQIWAKWTELSRSNPSSLLLHGVRNLVKQKFLGGADHVIATYRTTDQPVYLKDWELARTMASRALAVDPDDGARARLRVAEGHIARINGMAHNSVSELNLAVEKFAEAQRLMPKSPDPELGLARVYVYGLKDIDRADQALRQAEKMGYRLGNREKSQLADGYMARADRAFWDSRNVRGLPQEKDEIKRSEDDYKRALQLYQQIVPYGGASTGIVRVEKSLESVDFRLNQLEGGR